MKMKYLLKNYIPYISWAFTVLSVSWIWLRFPHAQILVELMFISWGIHYVGLVYESIKLSKHPLISTVASIGLLTLLLGIIFKIHHLPGFEYLKVVGLLYSAMLPMLIIRKIDLVNKHYSLLAIYLFFLLAWLSQ